MIQDKLADCKTVIWNGPMGVFEMDAFAKGTFAICDTLKELTEKGAITIIGGGDSVAAVEGGPRRRHVAHAPRAAARRSSSRGQGPPGRRRARRERGLRTPYVGAGAYGAAQ